MEVREEQVTLGQQSVLLGSGSLTLMMRSALPGDSLPISLQVQLYDLELTLSAPKEAFVKVHIEDIIHVTGKGKVEGIETDISEGKFHFRILVDHPSREVIANHGLVYLP